MSFVVYIIIIILLLDLLTFSGIIGKRFYRNVKLKRLERLKGHYNSIFAKSFRNHKSPWSQLTKKEAARRRYFIEAALKDYFKNASKDKIKLVHAFIEEAGYFNLYKLNLKNRKPLKRAQAAEILGDFEIRGAVPALIDSLNDPSEVVRSSIIRALGRIDGRLAAKVLVNTLNIPRSWTPSRVVTVVTSLGKVATPYLVELMTKGDDSIKPLAALCLGDIGDRRSISMLTTALKSDNVDLRTKATEALGKIGDKSALFHLSQAASDPSWSVRVMAAKAMGTIKHSSSVPILTDMLADANWWVRTRAADSLINLGSKGEKALIATLSSNDRFAREKAAEVLQSSGILKKYLEAASSPNPKIKKRAFHILRLFYRVGATSQIEEFVAAADNPTLEADWREIILEKGKKYA